MEEKNIIKITDENGVLKDVEVLHYFTLNSNNKDYIVYTENELDANGKVLIHTSEVIDNGDEVILEGIEDMKVLEEIKEVLLEIIKDE